ncbi:hypothetical protein ACH4L5_16850 [Streptomyces sp. NPDC017405]|uniref:hypothetical protein n=1 Tax=unclassified Streptomyces TaxID=2593676 RepID=UPI00379BB59B
MEREAGDSEASGRGLRLVAAPAAAWGADERRWPPGAIENVVEVLNEQIEARFGMSMDQLKSAVVAHPARRSAW